LWGVQKAASDFLKALPDGYQVSVLGFNDEVFLAQDFTAAPRPLLYAVHQLRVEGETALFDAVRAASLHLRGRPERRAVVLFTDGQESIYGRDAEGEAKLREALDAANLAEATFFAIGYGGGLAADLLERIAADTGGKFFPAGPKLDLGRVYAEIASTLGSQYTLAYYPDPPPPPGEWRSLEVRVNRDGAAVRARRGYWAKRR
ncbi:MAG: VWA domain-containing protein, partial [Acidobacteria bacterium]|nr:VWA domain-containing protein [Acidobacteriota bacterium]